MDSGDTRSRDPRFTVHALKQRVAELECAAADRHQAESALRESEQLYRSLVQTSPDSIILTDIEGRIVMANNHAAVLHGFACPDEMLGVHTSSLVAPEDQAKAAADIQEVIRIGQLRDQTHMLLRKDGSSFTGEMSGSLITDAEGKPKWIIYNGRDITERQRLQRELIESQKLESIGRLAGGIAHDFNNLLAVVLGNASLLLRHESQPGKTTECLNDIIEAAERASSLTSQLLAYARGGLRKPVSTDLNKRVKAVWEIVHRTAPPQVEFVLDLAEALPPIMADPTQIEQVIMNLCLNALQASRPPGRIELKTGMEKLSASRARALDLKVGLHVFLKVIDHGSGMDGKTLDRIFEPFFSTRAEGRGMGLPATLGIVQSHGGAIHVDSVVGQGTEVVVWLPPRSDEDTAHITSGSQPRATPLPQGKETILAVDDDAKVAHTAAQILSSLGYCVITHTVPDQALTFLDNNGEEIDLILLNLNMPKYTGPEMLERVRQRCPHTPVLLISGFGPNEMVQDMLASGATAFLAKPFSLHTLAETVRQVLDQRMPRQDSR